jgi:hypothetical protein
MYLFNFVTYLLFVLPHVSCKVIYTDKSCKAKADWKEYWKETRDFASELCTV